MTTRYYFIDSNINPDTIYGDQYPVCLPESEVKRLSAEYGVDLFEQMHEADADEIATYGVYEDGEGSDKMKIQFEAGPSGNILAGESDSLRIFCEIEVPEDASDDYGYLTMKAAILAELTEEERKAVSFWYDGQEQHLAEDAAAGEISDIRIERF